MSDKASLSGVTFSFANKIVWSTEYEYNGAGLDRTQWRDLGNTPQRYRAYRAFVRHVQDPPTKRTILASLRWQDAFVRRFDLSVLARVNLEDRSSMWWVEGAHHFETADIALQFQRQRGSLFSEFGALPDKWAWQLLLRHHF